MTDINNILDNLAGLTLKEQVIKGQLPQSWHCVGCGRDTAPGNPNRSETESAWSKGVYPQMRFDHDRQLRRLAWHRIIVSVSGCGGAVA